MLAAYPSCGSSTSYPISGSPPIADDDINCGFYLNSSTKTLYPRNVNLSYYSWPYASLDSVGVNLTVWSEYSYSVDFYRRIYRLPIQGGRKLSLPVNINPSQIATIEYFFNIPSTSGIPANWLALWSTELFASTQTGITHSRTLAIYEPGSQNPNRQYFYLALGPNVHTNPKLRAVTTSTPMVHVAIIYDHAINNVTLCVNGRWCESRIFLVAEGISTIAIGGVKGRIQNDAYQQNFVSRNK